VTTQPFLAELRRAAAADAAQAGPTRRVDWAMGIGIATLACAGLLVWATGGYHAGFGSLNAWGKALPAGLWQGATLLGDAAAAACVLLLLARRHPQWFWAAVIATLVAIVYSRGLKPLLGMPRPPAVLPEGSFVLIGPAHKRVSFPSGHTLTAFMLAGLVAGYRPRWALLALALASAAGLSRVAVGVHWPLDVVGGAVGGLLAAWAGMHAARRWRWGLQPGPHLALVAIAAIGPIWLLLDDAGYPQGDWLRLPLAVSGVGAVVVGYVIPVARRPRTSTDARHG
jgi:membrane-associated phospholipid phosphatase